MSTRTTFKWMSYALYWAVFFLLVNSCQNPRVIDTAVILTLADELWDYQLVTEIDDCTKSKKYLNETRIYLTDSLGEVDQIAVESNNRLFWYKDVLNLHGIEKDAFDRFVQMLRETQLRHYYRRGNYSVFVTGGALGEIDGYIVVHNNAEIPINGFRLTDFYYVKPYSKVHDRIYVMYGD